ncbi:hypothetical protein ACFP3I_01105 [Chryseobacterium arachidis]|uniref:hypothetical protein n=1 Tax=Chryseobacterium arachidis TaxID=1416778 RepID=UPI0009344D3F
MLLLPNCFNQKDTAESGKLLQKTIKIHLEGVKKLQIKNGNSLKDKNKAQKKSCLTTTAPHLNLKLKKY